MHKHKCPKCGTVWEHEEHCGGSELAHRCPTLGCGEEVYWHYDGSTPPTYLQSCRSGPCDGDRLTSTVILLSFNGQK